MPLLLSQPFTRPVPLTTPLPLCFAHFGHRCPRIAAHPFGARWRPLLGFSSCASRAPPIFAASTSNEELLQALVGYDGREDEGRSHLPAVRTYENDLARFTLIGAVNFDQALTAAAADGGDAAEEHLSSGLPTMVIETVYPGTSAHSTVSTRLFLPSREVKEKAKKIRGSLSDDIFSGAASRNILAMTFRQVMLHRVLSFELALFPPGCQRDMENLGSPREIPTELCINSENLSVIVALAEAICSCALECTKRTYLQVEGGVGSSIVSGWFQKPRRTAASSDSTVCVYNIPPNQIVENAQKRLDDFISMKGRSSKDKRKAKQNLWAPPTYSDLDKIGGTGFSDWTNEYMPAYRLQVDSKNLKDVKFKGWQKLSQDRWEVLLTHFQLVELADIMDMYYEDQYTLPSKQLSSGLIAQVADGTKSKKKFSWKMVSVILLGACVLVSLRIMAQIRGQNLFEARISSVAPVSAISENDYFQPLILDDDKSEALCLSVVQRIQDALGRHGHISVDRDVGAWVGEIPSCLSKLHISHSIQGVSEEEVPARSLDGDVPVPTELSTIELSPSQKHSEEDVASSTQDIASYQVALSRDGKVLGFQPTSRTAVPHWASNPLAEALYEGKKLSPGILEPNVKIPQPNGVVLVELLMSVNPDSWFVLARPIQ